MIKEFRFGRYDYEKAAEYVNKLINQGEVKILSQDPFYPHGAWLVDQKGNKYRFDMSNMYDDGIGAFYAVSTLDEQTRKLREKEGDVCFLLLPDLPKLS